MFLFHDGFRGSLTISYDYSRKSESQNHLKRLEIKIESPSFESKANHCHTTGEVFVIS